MILAVALMKRGRNYAWVPEGQSNTQVRRVQILWEEKSVCLRKMWLLLELSLEARTLCWEYSSIFVKSRYMIKQKIFPHLIWIGVIMIKKYVCPQYLLIIPPISWWNEMIPLIVIEWGPEDLRERPHQFKHNSWKWARRDLDKNSFESANLD